MRLRYYILLELPVANHAPSESHLKKVNGVITLRFVEVN